MNGSDLKHVYYLFVWEWNSLLSWWKTVINQRFLISISFMLLLFVWFGSIFTVTDTSHALWSRWFGCETFQDRNIQPYVAALVLLVIQIGSRVHGSTYLLPNYIPHPTSWQGIINPNLSINIHRFPPIFSKQSVAFYLGVILMSKKLQVGFHNYIKLTWKIMEVNYIRV